MKYHLAPLYCRPWTLLGISPEIIESHYENNYGGAVRRLNDITAEIGALDLAITPPETLGRLKRDQAALLNSALLHELYFASVGGDGRAVPPLLAEKLTDAFDSVDRWRREFISLAESLAGGGSGWVLLTWLPREGTLINQLATDHSDSAAGGIPILAIDMYEHAYHMDFGTNATSYVASFMRNIDWASVQGRFEDAAKVTAPRPLEQPQFADVPAVSAEEVKAMLDAGQRLQIIDARPRHFTTRSSEIMEGAVWRDPERVEEWIGEISPETPVVTFCVYGFHVGCQTAITLREKGFDARSMAGGHYAWKAMGGKVNRLEQ